MDNEKFSPEVLRKYLLGKTDAETRSLIAALQQANVDFADEIELAESRLIDAYLDQELGDAEREAFRETFLTTADRRASVDIAASVRRLATRDRAISRLKLFSILLAICVLAGTVVYRELLPANAVELDPNNSRSGAQAHLSLKDAPSTVLLRLRCPSIPPSHTATFGRVGDPQPLLTARIDRPASAVITLPVQKSLLEPGDYLIILSAGEEFRADFRIVVMP